MTLRILSALLLLSLASALIGFCFAYPIASACILAVVILSAITGAIRRL